MSDAPKSESASRAVGLGLVAGATGALVMNVAEPAQAQLCEIPRTNSKPKVKVSLERAFPDCTAPDTVIPGPLAVPACNMQAPVPGQWTVQDAKPFQTKNSIQLASTKDGDVTVSFSTKGIADMTGNALAEGAGQLVLTARMIVQDPFPGGPLKTSTNFAVPVPVDVVKGEAKVKTSINTVIPGALSADCYRLDVVGIELKDPLGNTLLGGPSVGVTQPLFSEKIAISFGTRG